MTKIKIRIGQLRNGEAWVDLGKFIGRVVLLGAVGAIVAALINLTPQIENETIKYVAGAILVTADKWIHANKDIKYNGIVPF